MNRSQNKVILNTGDAGSMRHMKNYDPNWLVRGGRAQAVIVVGQRSREFGRWIAGELRRYLRLLTGADFSIVDSGNAPRATGCILVGGPEDNALMAAARQRGLVDFSGLKRDGFLNWRVISMPNWMTS
ncbi:MAG: hypothetical protein HY360_26405 [Verrucomicrobia bacterium]|nr:hypothetical protein [Verrucomicrobiota bacterium]